MPLQQHLHIFKASQPMYSHCSMVLSHTGGPFGPSVYSRALHPVLSEMPIFTWATAPPRARTVPFSAASVRYSSALYSAQQCFAPSLGPSRLPSDPLLSFAPALSGLSQPQTSHAMAHSIQKWQEYNQFLVRGCMCTYTQGRKWQKEAFHCFYAGHVSKWIPAQAVHVGPCFQQ